MKRFQFKQRFWVTILLALMGALILFSAPAGVMAQEATPGAASPTSALVGAYVQVVDSDPPYANVRAGPNAYLYPVIGVLLLGETAPAVGRSVSGDWIVITYPGGPNGMGWVYAANVELVSQAILPIIEPPPTPIPTPAPVDPTQAAAFTVAPTATRLPTFTPPAPLVKPTYAETTDQRAGFALGPVILGLALVGVVGLIASLFGRR